MSSNVPRNVPTDYFTDATAPRTDPAPAPKLEDPADWQSHATAARAALRALSESAVSKETATDALRQVEDIVKSARYFGRTVESAYFEYLYDVAELLKAVFREDPEGRTTGEILVDLQERGVLSIRYGRLMKAARDLGIDTTRFRQAEGGNQ